MSHELSRRISRCRLPLGAQLLFAPVFYLMEGGKLASGEFVLDPQYRASGDQHPPEDRCSNNGKQKGGRDRLRAPKPKHTLQAFLLQREMQGKPSQQSASPKTHTWASSSLQQTPTEQILASLAKQPGQGNLEDFNKLLQIALNIISFSGVLYSYSVFLED